MPARACDAANQLFSVTRSASVTYAAAGRMLVAAECSEPVFSLANHTFDNTQKWGPVDPDVNCSVRPVEQNRG